jgi:hypothetical protein
MEQAAILFPMICLVIFTGTLGVALLIARYRAVREGKLSVSYFRYNRGGKPPEYLLKITHHFQNLMETPPLFYLALITILVLEKVDNTYIVLAWFYVASRFTHAWVHLSTNRVHQRKNAFVISYLSLFAIWIRLFLQLLLNH